MSFRDRTDAGRRLADRVVDLELDLERPIVLGLPRGGVPVAYQLALALSAPLDVVLVRKVGAPSNPEYGVGAVGEEGVALMNDEAVQRLGLGGDEVERSVQTARDELQRRLDRYRGGRAGLDVADRTCVVVDDGLATGVSADAAIRVLRERDAGRVVLAVPVGAPDSVDRLRGIADHVVCLHEPPSFTAVGTWYEDFSQTTDEEVVELLERAADELREEVHEQVAVGGVTLPADLVTPPNASGLVVFAHGSGSGRRSPRNRAVARHLNDAGLATVLFDLLTPHEAQVRDNVFDIDLLGRRLVEMARWARDRDELAGLPVVYFGASTGAAAALVAAASDPGGTAAVISRGGRPDLAGEYLADVRSPTLLIVGERDEDVIALNERAVNEIAAETEMVVVGRAGHLFEEPGALEEVARHAARWAVRHVSGDASEL